MTFKQFAAFMAAAKHLNVTQAARELHISQPSISKQLKLLQDDYHVKLYYKKDKGGIELTQEGRDFLIYVRRIFRDLDALKTRFSNVSRAASKPFVVGGTYSLASDLLPRLMSQFKETHTRLNVVLRTGSSFDIHKQILRGEIEIGLAVRTSDSKYLECEAYRTHQLVAFVHQEHPYAKKSKLSPAELARGPLVLRGGLGVKSGAEVMLKQCGYNPNVAVRCETLEAVRTAVRNNLGVGILSYDTVKNAIARGEFRLLRLQDLALEAQSFIIHHSRRPLSRNASEFLSLPKEQKIEPELA